MATPTEQIVIRGDLVEIEQRTIVRSMPLADLIPLIAVPPPMTFPRLPAGTRYARVDPGEGRIVLLVEVGPKIQSMRTSRHAATYQLTMPYQYYAFTATSTNFASDTNWRMDNWYLFWAPESVTSPDGRVIPAMLPNIYQDRGAICFGTTQPANLQTLSQRIDQIVNEFSVTTFNGDLGWNRPSAYRSFSHWQAESRSDPFGWRKWPEWSNALPLSDYFTPALTLIRPTEALLTNTIPAIRTGWTFGRAAEWLDSLTAQDRYRLIRALASRPDLTTRIPEFDPDDYPVENEPAAEPPAAPAAEPAAEPTPEPEADEVGTTTIFREPTPDEDEDTSDEDNEAELAVQFVTADPDAEPNCACRDRLCGCERVVLSWDATCAACLNGRHVYQ